MKYFSKQTAVLATSIGLGLSPFVNAQESEPADKAISNGFYGSVGYLGIDEEAARKEGVGDNAIVIEGGYYGVFNNLFVLKAGIYFPIIDDEASFDQSVEDNFGDVSTESSDINGYGVVVEGGVRFSPNETINLGASVGFRSLTADRDIAYCTNCRSDDIDLSGGAYITYPAITPAGFSRLIFLVCN